MKEYSDDIVKKYINGEDIIEYNVDDLENDTDFMIKVFQKTNDKNIYNLCGEKVKKDPHFIKYMITKFNNDIEFIRDISDYYFLQEHDEVDEMDIIILMCEYSKHKNKETYEEYSEIRNRLYDIKKIELEIAKKEAEENELLLAESGMYFMVIQEYYKNNPMTVKYFAKRFIAEILTEEKDFETLVHDKFKTPEDLEKYGMKKYLIDLINAKDKSLASYAIVHITILTPFLIELKQIIKNWDQYLKHREKEQYLNMFEEVEKYMEKVGQNGLVLDMFVLYIAARELGIEEKIKEYGEYDDNIFENIKADVDMYEEIICEMGQSIHIANVRRIMLKQLKGLIKPLPIKTKNNKTLKLLKTKKDTK